MSGHEWAWSVHCRELQEWAWTVRFFWARKLWLGAAGGRASGEARSQ